MLDSTRTAEKSVAVIIVNWNGWRECIECLDSLFAQLHQNIQVFVVDNDSHDGSIERIVDWCEKPTAEPTWHRHTGVLRITDRMHPEPVPCRVVEHAGGLPQCGTAALTLIRSGGNLGFAGGCNLGVVTAGIMNFDYFWLLNADAVVEQSALVELIARAERQADIGIVGSVVRYYHSPDVIQALGGSQLNRSNGNSRHLGEGSRISETPIDASVVERDMTYVMGASMLVSRRYILEIGLMQEDYFLYFEDADWCMRGSPKFKFGFAPNSHIFHKWGANSHKSASRSSETYYYRNRLRFVTRFLPGRLAAAKRAMFEQLLRHIARGRWRQAKIVFSTLLFSHKITMGVSKVEENYQ
jgi:GT2 family glycosyltransferase